MTYNDNLEHKESELDEILESFSFEDQRTDIEKRKDKKYEYREITYNKQDVSDVEKKAMGEMLLVEADLNKYSEVFITRATTYYPELLIGFELKKKRENPAPVLMKYPLYKNIQHFYQDQDDDDNFEAEAVTVLEQVFK